MNTPTRTRTQTLAPSRTLACAFGATVLALSAWLPSTAQAQSREDVDLEQLRAIVGAQLGPLMPEGSSALVEKLSSVKPDGAISRSFRPAEVSKALFGRVTPQAAPDCNSTSTNAGEPDGGLCHISAGSRDAPRGAYTVLSYSKQIGLGHISFMRREAFDPASTALPSEVKLDDREAYAQALAFLELLGVPKSEIPQPPSDAKNPLPVRTLEVGYASADGRERRVIPVQKVVQIPRAFEIQDLYVNPASGQRLNHALVPGSATVVLDDRGVQMARVNGWADAQMDPSVDPKLAKSVQDLVDEIAQDLYAQGVRQPSSVSVRLGLGNAYPNPEVWPPVLCPVCGVLRPMLFLTVSQVGQQRTETGVDKPAIAGLLRQYDLVAPLDADNATRAVVQE